MEGIGKPGVLSDEELAIFLNEIEEDEDKLSDMQRELTAKIAEKEDGLSHPDEALEDGAWDDFTRWSKDKNTGVYWITDKEIALCSEEERKKQYRRTTGVEKARALGVNNSKENARLKRERKQLITRFAFKQNDILLSNVITQEQCTKLIELLTDDYRDIIAKITIHVNDRLTSLLRPMIPKTLKNCYVQFPDAMKSNPGFMYTASKEYGQGITFWATPDIPCFFQQGTESQILREKKACYLFTLDKYLIRLKEAQVKLADCEVRYASKLVQMKKGTFYDLLKMNAFWFELLYKGITFKNLIDE